MFEITFLAIATAVAWYVGHMVAESPLRHWAIAGLALLMAGVAGASHMAVDGFPLLIAILAVAAGMLGKHRARQQAYAKFRKEMK